MGPATPPPATRSIHWDGTEAFFPKPQYGDAIYEITITGAIKYPVKQCTGLFASVKYEATADALSFTRRGDGRQRHDWLKINHLSLGYWHEKMEMLEADYESHKFRFLLDDPDDQLQITFKLPGEQGSCGASGHCTNFVPTSGALSATVRVLPAGTPTIAQRRKDAKAKRKAEHALVAPPPPEPPRKESTEEWRERQVRHVERSNEDMRAILRTIAEGRQKLMEDLDALKLDAEGDLYLQYKSEIENWTAGQLVQFTARKGADNASATVIG